MNHRWFWLGVVILHVGYFACALTFADIYTDDSEEYLQMAENIRTEGVVYAWYWGETHQPKYYTLRPPVYGLFILFAQWWWDSVHAVLLWQNLISLSLLWVMERLLRKWGIGDHRYWILLGALLLFPTYLIFVNKVMTDFLLGALLFYGWVTVAHYLRTRQLGWWLGYNLLLCVALYLKPVMIYFWLPNLLLAIWYFQKDRRWAVLLVPLVLLLAMQSWRMRNERVTGWRHFSSIQTINLCRFNMRQLLRTKYDKATADATVDQLWAQADEQPDFAARSQFLNDTCGHIILEHWPTYGYVHLRGMASFYLDPGRHDILKYFRITPPRQMSFFNQLDAHGLRGLWDYVQNISIPRLLLYIGVMCWNVLTLLALLRLPFDPRLDVRLRLLLFLLVVYISALSVTIGYSRFKVGVYPLLMVALAVALPWYYRQLRRWMGR